MINTAEKNKVTFDDVAGLTEEKEEVAELIDFLKVLPNSKKWVLEFLRVYY